MEMPLVSAAMFAAALVATPWANADHQSPELAGNTLIFPDETWYEVEVLSPGHGIVCTSFEGPMCKLIPGNYKWVFTKGVGTLEEGVVTVVPPQVKL